MSAIFRLFRWCSCSCIEEDRRSSEPAALVSERVRRQMPILKNKADTLNSRFGWGPRVVSQRVVSQADTQTLSTGNLESAGGAEEKHGSIDQSRTDRDIDKTSQVYRNRQKPEAHS